MDTAAPMALSLAGHLLCFSPVASQDLCWAATPCSCLLHAGASVRDHVVRCGTRAVVETRGESGTKQFGAHPKPRQDSRGSAGYCSLNLKQDAYA